MHIINTYANNDKYLANCFPKNLGFNKLKSFFSRICYTGESNT